MEVCETICSMREYPSCSLTMCALLEKRYFAGVTLPFFMCANHRHTYPAQRAEQSFPENTL